MLHVFPNCAASFAQPSCMRNRPSYHEILQTQSVARHEYLWVKRMNLEIDDNGQFALEMKMRHEVQFCMDDR